MHFPCRARIGPEVLQCYGITINHLSEGRPPGCHGRGAFLILDYSCGCCGFVSGLNSLLRVTS